MSLLHAILQVALSAAPWLLLGLTIAGLIKALLPEQLLQRWVGGHGVASVTRAAIIGAPLPLCSCGAIPTALALHRGGAARGPTTAFLIGTPGIGVDSLAISYALLGPFMAAARALSAVITAIATGLLVGTTASVAPRLPRGSASRSGKRASGGCAGSGSQPEGPEPSPGARQRAALRLQRYPR